jgi:Fur family peroxide stress response transcriptional regulator
MNKRVVDRLRDREVTPTPQRIAILEHIQKRSDHPTAEEIHLDLRLNLPSLSRATIYNTLELLCKLGEIQQLTITSKKARYDPNSKPHHHFFCWRCERELSTSRSPAPPLTAAGWRVIGSRQSKPVSMEHALIALTKSTKFDELHDDSTDQHT